MWEFPSIQDFFVKNASLIFLSAAMLIVSIFSWRNFYVSLTGKTEKTDKRFVLNIVTGIVTFTILVIAFGSIVSSYKNFADCRNLDLGKVKSISVGEMIRESSSSRHKGSIKDTNKIRQGLEIVRNSVQGERNSHYFKNGYKLKLVIDEEPDKYFLYYFSETESGEKVDVIFPVCGSHSSDLNSDGLGIYSSADFGNWIRENIEP